MLWYIVLDTIDIHHWIIPIRLPCADAMLGHRLRRWPSIASAQGKRIVFTGLFHFWSFVGHNTARTIKLRTTMNVTTWAILPPQTGPKYFKFSVMFSAPVPMTYRSWLVTLAVRVQCQYDLWQHSSHVTKITDSSSKNNKCWFNVGRRRGRWPNSKPALNQSLVLAGFIRDRRLEKCQVQQRNVQIKRKHYKLYFYQGHSAYSRKTKTLIFLYCEDRL